MAYDPGTMGTNWRGRDRATILNDRYARQNARTAAQQPPPAQQPPGQAPPGANNLPPVTQPEQGPQWVDWSPWNYGQQPGGQPGPYAGMPYGDDFRVGQAGDGRPSYIPADYDPVRQQRDFQQWDTDPWSIAQREKAIQAQRGGQQGGMHDAMYHEGMPGGFPDQGGGMQNMEQMLMQLLGGGQMQGGAPGVPTGQFDPSLYGAQQAPGGYGGPSGIGGGGIDDPIQMYLSTVPVMDNMMRNRVSGAMNQAGLTGSRFGSGAQHAAAKIGGETSLQQNQMLNDLLYRHTQSDLDRGLDASKAALGFGAMDLDRGAQSAAALGNLGLGMSQDQQARDNMLGQYGMWEQGRQDNFANTRYEDFINSRMGYLPMLFQFLGGMGQGPGQPQGYQINQGGGQTGLMDIIPLLLSMFGGD